MAQLAGASGSKKRRRWGEEPEEADAAAAAAEEEEDRISALPEDLRLRILALLPLKSAIRTGALSTRWRALWARRWPAPSSLDLDFRSGDDPERLLESLERRGRRRLDRFSLTIHLRDREDIHPKRYLNEYHLDRCLGYAASCDVADLRIDIEDHMVSVFSELSLPPGSSQLARISLRCVSCVHIGFAPSDAFSALEVISLYSVISIDLDNLLAACPQLRTLDLRYCQFVSHLGTVSVNAARRNLRSLTVAECDDVTHLKANMASGLRSFCLSSAKFPTYDILATAVLDDLYINLRGRNGHPLEHWIKALPDLTNLTVLTICSFALQRVHALAICGSATCLTKLINLRSLRELQLLMFKMDRTSLAHIYEFLRMCRCPKMERLFVQLPTSSQDTFIDKSLEIAEEYGQGAEQSEECEPDAELPKEDEQDEELSEDDEPDAELPKDDGPDAGLSEEYKTDEELSEEYETEEELSSKELLEEYKSLLYEDVHEEDPSENVLEDEQSNEDVSEHGLNNFVFARMVLFKGRYFEMRLASFLLRKATGLKKLVLVAPEGNHMEALGKDSMDTPCFLETELLRLKNVSTNAQIVLSDSAPDANQPLHSDVFASFWFSVR